MSPDPVSRLSELTYAKHMMLCSAPPSDDDAPPPPDEEEAPPPPEDDAGGPLVVPVDEKVRFTLLILPWLLPSLRPGSGFIGFSFVYVCYRCGAQSLVLPPLDGESVAATQLLFVLISI